MAALDNTYDCIQANLYDPVSGWGVPTMIQDNFGGFMKRACIGASGEAYVSWLRMGDTWDSYVLAANRHTPQSGWEGESVISELTNISGFAMTADVARDATVIW